MNISLGSAAELETQIEVSNRLLYGDSQTREHISELPIECMKMLTNLSKSFNN
ncbi:MAG: four helix bundle protein [Candidatus Paceibacterota bacterium]